MTALTVQMIHHYQQHDCSWLCQGKLQTILTSCGVVLIGVLYTVRTCPC